MNVVEIIILAFIAIDALAIGFSWRKGANKRRADAQAVMERINRDRYRNRFTHWPDGTEVEIGDIDRELAELLS